MSDPYIEKLEMYLAASKKYNAKSYNVSADFLMATLSRLKHSEATIEKLHGLLHVELVKGLPPVTYESKP